MKYMVHLKEVYSNDIMMEADSAREAEEIASQMYSEGPIDMFCDSFEVTCTGEVCETEV